ncbi:MAG: TIGR02757 family protein [Pseudomonadota bacterium]|nr:TIGR02757 family protein [Pseudomonadota bacterium]
MHALAATPANLARDPVRFPRAYADLRDVEVAAVLSAQLAYGRVDLFGPVIARILALADAHGGPAAYVLTFDDARAADLAGVIYRWNRGEDFVLLFRLLQAVYRRHASLGELFQPGPVGASLGAAIDTLRALTPGEPSRGFRTWLAHPGDGSACKRWLMFLRWMVRVDGMDLGRWTHLSPRDLVIPLDTHVMRLSGFLGLTRRNDASWRTAEEVTAALRCLDPDDPVRFDFALAHLGISGACLGHRDADVCPACPLAPMCHAPAAPARPTESAPATPAPAGRRAR